MCPTKHFAKIDITTRNMTGQLQKYWNWGRKCLQIRKGNVK